jgi:hypothetical protein
MKRKKFAVMPRARSVHTRSRINPTSRGAMVTLERLETALPNIIRQHGAEMGAHPDRVLVVTQQPETHEDSTSFTWRARMLAPDEVCRVIGVVGATDEVLRLRESGRCPVFLIGANGVKLLGLHIASDGRLVDVGTN